MKLCGWASTRVGIISQWQMLDSQSFSHLIYDGTKFVTEKQFIQIILQSNSISSIIIWHKYICHIIRYRWKLFQETELIPIGFMNINLYSNAWQHYTCSIILDTGKHDAWNIIHRYGVIQWFLSSITFIYTSDQLELIDISRVLAADEIHENLIVSFNKIDTFSHQWCLVVYSQTTTPLQTQTCECTCYSCHKYQSNNNHCQFAGAKHHLWKRFRAIDLVWLIFFLLNGMSNLPHALRHNHIIHSKHAMVLGYDWYDRWELRIKTQRSRQVCRQKNLQAMLHKCNKHMLF